MPASRPFKFKSPEEVEEKGKLFFEWCKETDRFPTVAGFAVFLECDRVTVWNYENRPGFSTVLKAIKDKIYDEKLQAALKGEAVASLVIWDAVNNHGMVNTKTENKNETDLNVKAEMSTKDLKLKLKELRGEE